MQTNCGDRLMPAVTQVLKLKRRGKGLDQCEAVDKRFYGKHAQ